MENDIDTELDSLIQGEGEGQSQSQPQANNGNMIKEQVKIALRETQEQRDKENKQQQQNKRREEAQRAHQEEQAQFSKNMEEMVETIKQEAQTDPEFKKIIQNGSFDENLLQYIASVALEDEAPDIIRELAHNEKYREALKKNKGMVGRARLITKVRRDVLTGGSQGEIPEVAKRGIKKYNPNAGTTTEMERSNLEIAQSLGLTS